MLGDQLLVHVLQLGQTSEPQLLELDVSKYTNTSTGAIGPSQLPCLTDPQVIHPMVMHAVCFCSESSRFQSLSVSRRCTCLTVNLSGWQRPAQSAACCSIILQSLTRQVLCRWHPLICCSTNKASRYQVLACTPVPCILTIPPHSRIICAVDQHLLSKGSSISSALIVTYCCFFLTPVHHMFVPTDDHVGA